MNAERAVKVKTNWSVRKESDCLSNSRIPIGSLFTSYS